MAIHSKDTRKIRQSLLGWVEHTHEHSAEHRVLMVLVQEEDQYTVLERVMLHRRVTWLYVQWLSLLLCGIHPPSSSTESAFAK